ncbi:flagellar basal-body MS-ring/collar protein FliF [Sphingomonas sp.]|uniref:flagellar basal-body MS-ring/collar protein FliF n=1 Tax=Sphingomonas sp. TaxID=28214 RepID=UPI001B11BD32|nr:flagellar basal-body MS-ring/collar protein FliF [Sphingomonas sp.]MBO9713927.1 flagellar M-ring protein FliF [Sphingomonas sp.]
MSNVPVPANGMPQALAAPLRQATSLLGQPAVRRAMPFLFLIGLAAAGWLAWSMVATAPQRILFANLSDADKASVTSALDSAGIPSAIDGSGSVTVAEDQYHKARMLLASQDLPKGQPGGYQILDQLPMGVSRAVEGERLRQARETELARSIQEIDSIAEARVHLATPEASAFVRDHAQPSASVIVKLQPGRALGDAQIRAIVNLVASSVPRMAPESVTIVDQMGALLSKSGSGDPSGSDNRIDFQRRVEEKYRTQLVQLLTPMVGGNNFTAEVQADVNLDESQATRESYDKDGTLRAEQGNWTGSGEKEAPGGIPGALSNTPPPPSTLTSPNAAAKQPQPSGPNGTINSAASTPGVPQPAPSAAASPEPQTKQSDSFSRAYDLGKEVSVTRQVPGNVKRLSVAVLLREESGKPRSKIEIDQITQLVRAAMGFDPARGDVVTVISRKFNPLPELNDAAGPAWYDAAWVPLVARNVTALLIAVLVLFLGIRPLTKALLRKRDDAARPNPALAMGGVAQDGQYVPPPAPPPVSIDMLQSADTRGYEERVGMVRGFTRDNPARAALAVRDMIKADAP